MAEQEESHSPPETSVSTAERVTDLIGRMTLEEKVGQLTGSYIGTLDDGPHGIEDVIDEIDDHHVGAVAPFGWGGSPNEHASEAIEAANELQRHAKENTRLGIPLLFGADAIHGHAYIKEATVFPNNLGLAATWDDDLAERVATVTRTEMRATGAAQNYSPTCDVARDQRWGRVGETFGESPYLVGKFAASKVRGYQGDGPSPETVAATAKHFPAYGAPTRGEDAAPVEISTKTLHDVFLPPFEEALDADVASVMPCYNSIDGEPVHGSQRYLLELLGEGLGFDGLLVSDWGGVDQLHAEHRTAGSPIEAALQTRLAGLDIASVAGTDHAEHVLELAEEGELSEDLIDESIERILTMKFRLGLFEDPYVDPETAEDLLGSSEHQRVAREAVEKSLTLLQNDGDLLPLSDDIGEVFVGGPNADEIVHQLGGWSSNDPDGVPGTTVLEGIRDAVGEDVTVTHERGSGINEPDDIDAAARAAANADVAVLALGEDWYLHEFGPTMDTTSETGEFPTRSQLSLPESQRELVAAVEETGTPVVAVLITGRPLAVQWLADTVPSILMAYYPGTVGGEGIARTLFGESEPGGRLPVSMPRSADCLPTYFNYLPHPHPIGADEHPPSYDPLFEFGYGLSYTTIEYDSVDVSSDVIRPDEPVTVDVSLENTGDRRGSEVVQLFACDEFSSVVTPVRELKGFERVELDPGERMTVSFSLSTDDRLFAHEPSGYGDVGRLRLFVGEHVHDLRVDSN
ncbi:glycoside hydrolase family 3 N-terminal domain-containing protein [Haladaptatus sp. AB643]|uniref:glycoside hydrolase family 3 N-terminal domain-containing protein n=1 Tax=Haladaptatus sp. AB643 TaxID=2934174 RepID=UPI00209C1BEF|nr:glycoside hydrolase family 3 N-terminal domain-containing protein [Haladaptatus sp. AB643]MCO8244241.1 glycoside hydrolase family 3 C-terminal domain-containing protein [Haladaptatus sp. AB643]